MAFFNQI